MSPLVDIMHLNPTRLDALQSVTDALYYLADSHRFVVALNLGFVITGLQECQLGHRMGVSTSTVARWRMGYSLPHGMARRPILNLFLDRLVAMDTETRC